MNPIDLTADSDVEYSWPSNRPVRKKKLTNQYTPEDETSKKRKKSKKVPKKKYIGYRVAKYFGDVLYFGTVDFADEYYHIVYDDGDEEDIDAFDLKYLIKLHRREGNRAVSSFNAAQIGMDCQYNYHKTYVTPMPHAHQKDCKPNHCNSSATITPHSNLHAKKSSNGPNLFEIHSITPNQIEGVRQILPRRHQDCAEYVAEFFLLCYERQLIWQRKRSGLKDLTRDRKMAHSFYCNVYRELDRGTQYFRSNLIHHRSCVDGAFDLKEVLWDSLCYRLVNKIETFEAFGRIPCREEYQDFAHGTFLRLWNSDTPVFTGAHQNMGKDRYLATMNSLWKNDGKLVTKLASRMSSAQDLESCYKVLLRVDNVGKFFAWQVLCDLLEAKVIPFSENDWVQLGPGAKEGIRAIFGRVLTKTNELVEKARLLHEIHDQVYHALGLTFPRFIGKDITLKNIEHALCEFCKYKDNHVMRKFEVGGKGSRSNLDMAKVCQVCDQRYNCTRSKLCDLCRAAYCERCSISNDREIKGAWLCSSCIKMEAQNN